MIMNYVWSYNNIASIERCQKFPSWFPLFLYTIVVKYDFDIYCALILIWQEGTVVNLPFSDLVNFHAYSSYLFLPRLLSFSLSLSLSLSLSCFHLFLAHTNDGLTFSPLHWIHSIHKFPYPLYHHCNLLLQCTTRICHVLLAATTLYRHFTILEIYKKLL